MTTQRDLLAELLRSTPSVWTQEVRWIRDRVTGKSAPYSFKGRPFLVDPHDCQASRVVVIKGSQTGFTELGINRALHSLLAQTRDVLTVLPQDEQIRTFVQGRVDGVLEESPTLASVPTAADNPKHKRIGSANWYFRGSNSPQSLVEIPVSLLVLDEFDRLGPEAIPLARERLTGIAEHERRELDLSTPTHAGRGIDHEYAHSSGGKWLVPCVWCEEVQELQWLANIDPGEDPALVGEAKWKCAKCGRGWSEEHKRRSITLGSWVHENPTHDVVGYRLSQLYAPTETAKSLVRSYWTAKLSPDPSQLRTFFNSKLATAWSDGTEKLTDAAINGARTAEPYRMRGGRESDRVLCSMGIDVGPSKIHVSVSEWEAGQKAIQRRRRVVALYVVTEWEDVDDLITRHGATCVVVDSLPETRNARELQDRFIDVVWLAKYHDTLKDVCTWNGWGESDKTPLGMTGGWVDIARTMAFDRLFARFKDPRTILLPEDLPDEARAHLTALVAIHESDRYGHPVKRWDNGTRADHFAHAMLYDEIAGMKVGDLVVGELPQERGLARPFSVPEIGDFGDEEP